MNWTLVAAGAVMLVGTVVHFVFGDEALRKIVRLELPANRFGGPADTKVALRISWHLGTIAFAVLGAWLLATGLQPDAAFALGVTYFSGTLLSCYALIAVTARIYMYGLASFYKNPGPIILGTASILVWWGSTSL